MQAKRRRPTTRPAWTVIALFAAVLAVALAAVAGICAAGADASPSLVDGRVDLAPHVDPIDGRFTQLAIVAAKGDEVVPKLGSRGGPGAGKRHIPADVKRKEIEASQDICRACKNPLEPASGSPRSREFDHAWPYSRGGDTTLENIQALCRTCNRQKGAKTTQEYLDWPFPGRR